MLDFGALPPEINSARMYSGPGVGPMMAAASGWDALAAQLESFAAGYCATLSELEGQTWSGGASLAMVATVRPYVAWATMTAAQAEQAAAQARAAAAAYETAFAATVPPPVVATNRMRLAILVATNFFGQNLPAIAATEAEYAEMWAQDAAAMYGYAAASQAASTLTSFSPPPRTSNSGGETSQAAAVIQAEGTATGDTQVTVSQLTSAVPSQLQTLASGVTANASPASSPAATTSMVDAFSTFNTLVTSPAQPFWSTTYAVFAAGNYGTGSFLLNRQLAKVAGNAAASGAATPRPAGVHGPVLATVGKAAPVGKLSVPQSWATANSVANTESGLERLPGNGIRAAPTAEAHSQTNELGGGLPTARGADRAGGVPVLRKGRRTFTMPRPPHGG